MKIFRKCTSVLDPRKMLGEDKILAGSSTAVLARSEAERVQDPNYASAAHTAQLVRGLVLCTRPLLFRQAAGKLYTSQAAIQVR